jgi:Domain of unknown function (DUF6378)
MGAPTTSQGRRLQRNPQCRDPERAPPPRCSSITAEQLLERAASVVSDRRRSYGQPCDLFERVAVRWSQVLGIEVTPAQVIVCLIDLKVARLTHDPQHLASITDIAGYAGCLAEVGR